MARVKLTKNELKLQRDALKRYERYLPTLQLKKQQLQLEVRQVREKLLELVREEELFSENVNRWIRLLSPADVPVLEPLISVREVRVGVRNIAGTDTPVFEEIDFAEIPYDVFAVPYWFGDVIQAVQATIRFRLRLQIMEEQISLLESELRVVSQRVNLFEKVKIPECRGNIKMIQIYLGDQQTGAVGRAKIAKEKCRQRDAQVLPVDGVSERRGLSGD